MIPKEQYLKETKEAFEKHIGHTLSFNMQSNRQTGVLFKVTIDDGYVKLWCDDEKTKPFKSVYYSDQTKECSCGEGKN